MVVVVVVAVAKRYAYGERRAYYVSLLQDNLYDT
jgi:hypothetical protein